MADHNNPQSRDEEILIATIDRTEYNKLPQSRMEELLLELKETIEEGGGGGGTTNYENLSNQPQVNGETLIGDKSGADLGLVDAEEGKGLSTNDYDDTEKASVAAATSAITAMKDGSELDSFGDVEVALLDKADISDLGTAAAKDSTNTVTSGSTDLVESGAVKDAIDAAVAAAYHHAGTKTVAQLTHDLLVAANEGNVYNITDSGTTTSDFIEGIGKTIDEGSNVGICKVGNVYMFDLLSGFVDTTNFVQKSQTAGLLNNDGTVNTTIEDDIDSLKSDLTNLDNEVNGDATTYPYADVITIEDAVPANVADCSVKIEPVQDLHGYDHPWVGGAGKNKLPLVLADIKTLNTDGTWNDNVYTINNGTITVNTDDGGNVTGIKANGTFNATTVFMLWQKKGSPYPFDNTTYILNGCSNGSASTYKMDMVYNVGGNTNILVVSMTEQASADFSVISNVDAVQSRIVIYAGTLTNQMFYPMIRLSTETDATFAPYSNECPITGHTNASVDVHHPDFYTTANTVGMNQQTTVEILSDNSFRVYNTTAKTYISSKQLVSRYNLLVGKTYTMEADADIVSGNARLSIRNEANSIVAGSDGISESGHLVCTFILTSEMNYISFFATYDSAVIGDVTYKNIKFYEGEPKTYTIVLGDTIYGGKVNFNSGVMTVDRKIVDLGDLTWYKTNSNLFWSQSVSDFDKAYYKDGYWYADAICSHYLYATDDRGDYDSHITLYYEEARSYYRIFVSDPTKVGLTDAQYKTAVEGYKLCYKFATPLTVQLTPTQIQLLKGQNTLTASTGDISVTVNGVSGAIGAVQEQVNDTDEALAELVADIAEQLPTAPTTDGTYVLTVTVADGTPTYSWESAE